MKRCTWATFEAAFLRRWRTATFVSPPPDMSRIDWRRARQDWHRHLCTGAEAASIQLFDLAAGGKAMMMGGPLPLSHTASCGPARVARAHLFQNN